MIQVAFINHETWLICGGRKFSDQIMFDDVMVRLLDMYGCPSKVVHGDASGADSMAQEWANRLAIEVVAVPAEWSLHGSAAGPIRNEDMLMKHKPKRVVAFPGGRGTADMIKRVQNRKGAIELIEIRPAVSGDK